MPYWEEGTILNKIGEMVYIIQGQKHTHKRHLSQLKKRHEMDPINTQDEAEEPVEVIYDTCNLEPPNTLPNNEDRRGRGNAQTPIHRSKTEEALMENKPLRKQKAWEGVWGVPHRWTRPDVTYTS